MFRVVMQVEPDVMQQRVGNRIRDDARQQPLRGQVGQRRLEAEEMLCQLVRQVRRHGRQYATHERTAEVVREQVQEADEPRGDQQSHCTGFREQQRREQPYARGQEYPGDAGHEHQLQEQPLVERERQHEHDDRRQDHGKLQTEV